MGAITPIGVTRLGIEDEDRVRIVCRHCGEDAHAIKRDMGIGAYEYWGSREVHRDMRDCCSECGEEL